MEIRSVTIPFLNTPIPRMLPSFGFLMFKHGIELFTKFFFILTLSDN
jgi:hypothetical protein